MSSPPQSWYMYWLIALLYGGATVIKRRNHKSPARVLEHWLGETLKFTSVLQFCCSKGRCDPNLIIAKSVPQRSRIVLWPGLCFLNPLSPEHLDILSIQLRIAATLSPRVVAADRNLQGVLDREPRPRSFRRSFPASIHTVT